MPLVMDRMLTELKPRSTQILLTFAIFVLCPMDDILSQIASHNHSEVVARFSPRYFA